MTSLLSDKNFRKAFLADTIIIDCKDILLTQNGANAPKKYSGTGAIIASASSGISSRFIVFQPGDPTNSFFEELKNLGKVKSGQFFPDDHYYSLHAVDVQSEVWTCDDVRVTVSQYNEHAVIEFQCDWIKRQTSAEGLKDTVHILLPSAIKFPQNDFEHYEVKRNGSLLHEVKGIGSSGEAAGAKIRYRQHEAPEECFELIAEPIEGTLPPVFASKIVETIRFMTASVVTFFVSETIQGGVRTFEIAKPRELKKGLFPEPLRDSRNLTKDFYRLLDCYLRYSLQNQPNGDFSFISQAMHPLYNLGEASLDAIALLICVAIESVVQHEFKEFGQPNPAMLADLQVIQSAIKDLDIAEAAKNRAQGSLGGWKGSRITDKLFDLRDRGKVSDDDITNWKNLRNKAAHGNLHDSNKSYQELLDGVYKASTFLHKLVFLAIGYKGKFTDYSAHGWPENDFGIALQDPVPAEAPVASPDPTPSTLPPSPRNGLF